MGRTLQLKILELDEERDRLVMSNRKNTLTGRKMDHTVPSQSSCWISASLGMHARAVVCPSMVGQACIVHVCMVMPPRPGISRSQGRQGGPGNRLHKGIAVGKLC